MHLATKMVLLKAQMMVCESGNLMVEKSVTRMVKSWVKMLVALMVSY